MVAEKTPRKKGGCMDWEKIYAPAESPKGFTAQTANGTAKVFSTGWNRDDEQWGPMPAREGGPWQGGRNNRSGE